MQNFSPSQLQQYLADKDEPPLLLDVREPWEFERCHIEGSELVPMRELAAKLPELDPQREIVVICHHGIRSRHVGMQLEHLGFTNIINLAGGVDAWARDVDPEMAVY
jgi:rhodanese-related sulfurtransferase